MPRVAIIPIRRRNRAGCVTFGGSNGNFDNAIASQSFERPGWTWQSRRPVGLSVIPHGSRRDSSEWPEVSLRSLTLG